ncbi:hypothetical protein [Dialister sp.]|jgi:hypothetical protein|uniref:hypothetical protein n=1 Tax=Dialister sp. TaxID=1955814 RepID=UPI003A5C51A8
MINELYQLASTLENVDIDQEVWHRKYLNLPKVTAVNPCYCVMVDHAKVCRIFGLTPEEATNIRKFGNNQATFPAVNTCPLYRITDEVIKKKIEEIKKNPQVLNIEEIQGWCTKAHCNWDAKLYRKLKLSINSTPEDMLKIIGNQDSSAKNLLKELIEALGEINSEDDFYKLHNQLRDSALHNLEENILVSESLSLLFHEGSKEKDENIDRDRGKNIIVFDLYNGNPAHLPVIANAKFTHELNKLLVVGAQKKDVKKEIVATDAFEEGYVPSDDPMPQVKMPGFDMSIYTMFKGQPCQNRYGNFDHSPAVSYPLSEENRIRIKKAAEWIGKPDNKDRTWMKIGPKQVLLCYPSKMPQIPLDLLGIFTTEIKINEERFLNRAKMLIQQLRTLHVDEKLSFINVFVISKIDKARTKVLVSDRYSFKQVENSISDWISGCQNLPRFSQLNITEIYPMQLPDILNTVWKNQGNIDADKSKMTIMKRYEGVSFFFENKNNNEESRYLLHTVLDHISTFTAYAGNVLHAPVLVKRPPDSLLSDLSGIISSIALLLYRCGERKENYMKGLPYQLGQLLKISDDLHAFYCKIVRNGDVPPRLAGASLYVSASETPVKALAQLSVRMLPYITWAKSFRYKKDNMSSEHGLAGWYVKMYEQISGQLADKLSETTTFNDYDKAELFIGYMAAYPKKVDSNEEVSQNGK